MTAGGVRQEAWRRGGSSIFSQSDPHVLFGLGDQNDAASVEIHWPDGRVQTLSGVRADQVLTVREAGG